MERQGRKVESWVITIDGPAGAGKSTVARMLAERLGAVFLDTGAMYRALTAAAMDKGVNLEDAEALLKIFETTRFQFEHDGQVLRVLVDGKDYTQRIRLPEVTEKVRYAACQPAVRRRLVQMQQDFARQFPKVVTEGRDQGTVVFPNARWKFFLEADVMERARRRQKDLAQSGLVVGLDELREQIESRDASDRNRTVGPLTPAPDAVVVDTTSLTVQQVVETILRTIGKNADGGI
ncbi:MAG TPA: (d)CMP kinase [Anaerohalosphaeraceae bacterium]|nr:(d)CMP kinase [Anaerohalosphaeraceae bacterium]